MSRLSCWASWMLVIACSPTALAYDDAWHKVEGGWSGEYPNGFTVKSNVTVSIRPNLDLDAPKSVPCLLRKGATYHQWNTKRVAADQLQFVSFTKISTYEVNSDFAAQATIEPDTGTVTIHFKRGDRWTYLSYVAEGEFLLRFGETIYHASQDLLDASTEVSRGEGYDEWLGLKCANGAVGWVLFRDVAHLPEFGSVTIDSHGTAEDETDASGPRTYWDHNGSVVYLSAEGNRRKFYYHAPRDGMLRSGATPGSLLFDGVVIGDRYAGEAFIFKPGCGKLGYQVEGPILNNGRRVLLTGRAPRVGNRCNVIGASNDRLQFDLQTGQ